MALKYDPAAFVKVKLNRPLGITFEECDNFEGFTQKGVFVLELAKEGNAEKSGKVSFNSKTQYFFR
jgi:hypothetical protein